MKHDLEDFTLRGVAVDAASTRRTAPKAASYSRRPNIERNRPNNFTSSVIQVLASCAVMAGSVTQCVSAVVVPGRQHTTPREDTGVTRARAPSVSASAAAAVPQDAELRETGPTTVAELEAVAATDGKLLLAILQAGTLRPTLLSYAAEFAGRLDDKSAVSRTLLPLLSHAKSYVREGALYGLATCSSDDVLVRVRQVAATDPDPDVRAVAADLLDAAG